MDEPSDGEIYAAYSRRFESAEARDMWIKFLRMVEKEFPQDLPKDRQNPHDTRDETA